MPEPKIIYETEHFLAINKPAGLMVHAAKTSRPASSRPANGHPGNAGSARETTLTDWLLRRYPEVGSVGDDPELRPGIVHRLDKDTSGVMLVAKDQDYFDYLKSLFQNHQVKKTYYAVVAGVPKRNEGTIDAPIGIRSGTLKRSIRSEKMRKPAVTEYRVMKTIGRNADGSPGGNAREDGPAWSLLEVRPKTGRTHQIRVHLASIGHPVAGDRLYGAKKMPAFNPRVPGRLMLHAHAVEFPEKNGSMIRIESELPREFSGGGAADKG